MILDGHREGRPQFCGRTGKPKYDKKGAQSAINRRMAGRNAPELLRAFECKHCGRWHLTHKEKRD